MRSSGWFSRWISREVTDTRWWLDCIIWKVSSRTCGGGEGCQLGLLSGPPIRGLSVWLRDLEKRNVQRKEVLLLHTVSPAPPHGPPSPGGRNPDPSSQRTERQHHIATAPTGCEISRPSAIVGNTKCLPLKAPRGKRVTQRGGWQHISRWEGESRVEADGFLI